MDLGKYVATIEANIKNFENNLNTADSVYNSFAQKNIADEKKRLEAIKKIIEQETGIRVTNNKEIEEATKNFNASQISNVKKLANAYVVHNNKITASEQSRTKSIIAESQRIEKQKQKEQNALKIAEEKRARQAEQASARVQKALQREAEKAESLRRQILQWSTLAITVPIVFGTKKAMQDFIAFQSELYNVKAVTGATSGEMRQMTETALEMSQVFAKTGTEIATAFLQLGQAGYEASEILTSAKDVMLLSAAGMKDIDFTAELVVTTLKAFNLEADQSGRIVDVFASSAAKSVSSLDKISASLKYTAGLWGSQNWEIENLVGILDVLFDTGVRGEKAGRLLASSINGLQKPTASASKAIEKLLGDVDALNPAMNDVTAIVKKLADANAKTADIFQIFGKEGTDVMLRLIQNVEKIDGAIAEVTGQTGEAANQATIQMQSLGSQWDILKNKVTAFSKQVIGFMEPMFQSLIKSAGNFFDALNKMPDWLKTILTLGTTFALLGAPVAGLALKVKEFTAIMKIAGVTASATGLALKTAFPIMAAVGLAVGGIASAYAYSAKKHEEWISSVNSGIEKLEKEKKSLNDMVKEIETLYSTAGDTKEVTDSLRGLGEVFPELRKYINQNANDTAGAMAKMYEELAKLNTEKAKLAKTRADVANTVKDINIANQEKVMSEATANYNHILSTLLKSQGATERITKAFNDAFGAKKGNPIFNTFQDVLDKIKELSRESEDYKKIIDSLRDNAENEIIDVDELLRAVIAIREAKTELNELKRAGQTPITTTPVLSDKYSLQEAIGEVIEKIKKQYGTFDIQITAGTAEAESIIKSFGDIANSELLLIKEKYRKELMEVGAITPSGDWAEGFLAYMEEGAEKVSLAFDGNLNDAMDKLLESSKSLLTGASIAGLDDALKITEIQQAINANEVILAGLNKDKIEDADQYIKLTEENKEYKKQEVELAKNVNTQTRDALRILFGFIIEAEKLSGSGGILNKQLDWWGKIKQEISDIKNLLKGTDEITSLTDVMNQLSSATGEEYDKVISLGTALSQSFMKNPRLRWYAENFDIVNSVMDETIDKLKDLEIQQLKNAGIDTSIPEYIRQLEEAGDKVDSLSQQMLALTIASEPMDISGVTETINAIKEEISKSGEVDFGSLLGEIEEVQKNLQQQGKSTVQINEELVDLFGAQSVELYNQTKLAKSLEQYYKKIKDKYGKGVIELISKKQVNDAIDAEEQLLVSIGAMGKAQYEANKAFRERNQIIANTKALDEMIEKIELGTATYEEMNEVMNNLGKDSSFSTKIKELEDYTKVLISAVEKIKQKKKELAEAEKSQTDSLIDSLKQDISGLQGSLETAFAGILISTEDILEAMTKNVNLFKTAVDTTKEWKDAIGKGEAKAQNFTETISDWGYALGPFTLGLGTVIGLVFDLGTAVLDLKDSLWQLFYGQEYDFSYITEQFDKDMADAARTREIEDSIYQNYVSLGENIGNAIAQGIANGSLNVENVVKTQVFEMLASMLLKSTEFTDLMAGATKEMVEGFKEVTNYDLEGIIAAQTGLADINKRLTEIGSSGYNLQKLNTEKSKLLSEDMATYYQNIRDADETAKNLWNAAVWTRDNINKTAGKALMATWLFAYEGKAKQGLEAAKAMNVATNINIAQLQSWYDEAVILEGELTKIQGTLDELNKGTTSTEPYQYFVDVEVGDINTDDLVSIAEGYADKLQTIWDALEINLDTGKLKEEIRSSLQEAFISGALTGSYKGFKDAVYGIIVNNITQALMASKIISGRISSLVDSILSKATGDPDALTMNDVKGILGEIQSVWTDVTNENTPIGSLLMGLRDGLSEFGALDVNVNPGQVVTALPSEAMNKLDQAFQEVADRLSQAITESGLNSHIEIVNITTAYIEKMTANSVVINNAIFDMSGDLVLNNISGATVGEFLENLIKEQVASAMP